ncbi:MAG: hypothetical protein KGD57_04575 [Candidatus Lokiarchaeota archaeon]|nr:hypothetical protein [Candidatus Lokiarchaeota archaeon]
MNNQNNFFSGLLDDLSFMFKDSKVIYSIKPLKSNKNLIYELALKNPSKDYYKTFIIKKHQKESAEKEFNTLKLLKSQKINVPSVLFFKNPYIIQEKITGINLCDFINENLIGKTSLSEVDKEIRNKLYHALTLLAKWLANLHKKNIFSKEDFERIIVLNKGDTRLKDFIINFSNDVIYGLDFEESYEGNYLEDISWICCSLIDTNPGIFEMEEPLHKIELFNFFLKEYFKINSEFIFSFNYFTKSLIENLNTVIKRRGLNFGLLNKKTFLNKIIKEI